MAEIVRKHKKWWILLAVVLIIVFCIFFFRVKKVTVEGNTFYSQEQMAEMFQTNVFEKNLLTFWLMDKLSLTPKLDFVREYEVSYPSPNEIHIRLYEKTIVAGIAYTNQYIYFDKDGMVLQSTDKPLENIPLFETKSLVTFTLYNKIQMEDESLLSQIMNLANLFQHYQINWDRVQFNENNEAFLYIGDIQVDLGKKTNYDEQISALSSILETAERENIGAGEIDMTNYTVKGTVIFHKREEQQNTGAKEK
ncbi:MAG: FtsQ-type POTRA domain-containing protein [Lachnospiraceae bacterium]|nr:FtsQ-type POTRA domain-containing protein [Lachnospiraceae bacterium]